MKFRMKIEGDVLSLLVSDAEDTPEARGRVCSVELALLHHYGHHVSEPVVPDPEHPGKIQFLFHRHRSDHRLLESSLRLLKHQFGIDAGPPTEAA